MKIFIKSLLLSLIVVISSFTNANIEEKGASKEKDLPVIVFNAMKLNDFDQLGNYIPGEPELEFLEKTAAKKSKHLFDQVDSDRLKGEAKISFDYIIEEGVKRHINWADSDIMESGVENIDSPDKRISRGWFIVQDSRENQMKVSFDVIKVKNKWFAYRYFKAHR